MSLFVQRLNDVIETQKIADKREILAVACFKRLRKCAGNDIQSSRAHRHPGLTIVYVLEGEIQLKVGDGPETTYAAGQMFVETPSQLHAISRNASVTKPARFLAVLLAEKGKQLTTPA